MFGSTVLEIGIGLIFVYLVLGLLCTSINEYISQALNLRAENLYESIHGLFNGPDGHRLAEDIFDHPMICSLSKESLRLGKGGLDTITKKPSYIPASAFSLAVSELLGFHEPIGDDKNVDLTVPFQPGKLPYSPEVMQVLLPLVNSANNNLDQARKNIEKWYDDAMQRATGWYKRKAQIMTFLVAFCVVCISNADTLMIFDRLWANPVQRAQIAATAAGVAKSDQPADYQQLSAAGQDAALGLLGWADEKKNPNDPRRMPHGSEWISKILGLLITAFAASLGAPFWFDMLSKVSNIRAAGAPPTDKAKAQEGTSNEDKNRVSSSDAKDQK
jgi:hypothetical protein